MILLTKVDNLCKEVKKDISQVFFSEEVQKVVNKASEVFRVPRGNVFPVKNYEDEVQLREGVDILALLALRQLLNLAEDQMYNKRDKMAAVERGIQRLETKE